jgi:hypothetical protein
MHRVARNIRQLADIRGLVEHEVGVPEDEIHVGSN